MQKEQKKVSEHNKEQSKHTTHVVGHVHGSQALRAHQQGKEKDREEPD